MSQGLDTLGLNRHKCDNLRLSGGSNTPRAVGTLPEPVLCRVL